jgi:hypothetical protein
MEESLSKLLEYERNSGNLSGIRIVRGVKSINHSYFVDDTLLLEGDSTIMERIYKKILNLYIQVYVGLINHKKCQIYAWNVSKNLLNYI